MTAPPAVSPEDFYAQTKQEQADYIWDALFIKRSPVSEACRGIITTLLALGLQKEVECRDLKAIRRFFKSFRNDGIPGAERYCEHVYKVSGIRYAIMTNIPFDPTESQHWRPTPKVSIQLDFNIFPLSITVLLYHLLLYSRNTRNALDPHYVLIHC